MAIAITGTMEPAGKFPLAKAADIEMPDGTRLSDYNGMPEVTEADNGKILAAVNGIWAPVTPEIPKELPETSEADNGKMIQVIEGIPQYVRVEDSAVKTFVEEYLSAALEGEY